MSPAINSQVVNKLSSYSILEFSSLLHISALYGKQAEQWNQHNQLAVQRHSTMGIISMRSSSLLQLLLQLLLLLQLSYAAWTNTTSLSVQVGYDPAYTNLDVEMSTDGQTIAYCVGSQIFTYKYVDLIEELVDNQNPVTVSTWASGFIYNDGGSVLMALSDNGSYLAVITASSAKLSIYGWEFTTQSTGVWSLFSQYTLSFNVKGKVTSLDMVFTDDAPIVAIGVESELFYGTVQVYSFIIKDYITVTSPTSSGNRNDTVPTYVEFSNDASKLVVSAQQGRNDGSYVVYSLNNEVYEKIFWQNSNMILYGSAVAVSGDGSVSAVGSPGSNNVEFFDNVDNLFGALDDAIDSSEKYGRSLSFSDDGMVLGVCSNRICSIFEYSPPVNEKFQYMLMASKSNATSVTVSGDGLSVAFAEYGTSSNVTVYQYTVRIYILFNRK